MLPCFIGSVPLGFTAGKYLGAGRPTLLKVLPRSTSNTKGLRHCTSWKGTTGHSADDRAQGPASRLRSSLTVKDPLVKDCASCFMSQVLICCDFFLHFLPRRQTWYIMYKALISLAANGNIKTFDEMSNVSPRAFPSRTWALGGRRLLILGVATLCTATSCFNVSIARKTVFAVPANSWPEKLGD